MALYLLRAARSCAAPIILRRYEKRFVAVNPLPHVSCRPVAIMTRLAALTRLFMDRPLGTEIASDGVLVGEIPSRRLCSAMHYHHHRRRTHPPICAVLPP